MGKKILTVLLCIVLTGCIQSSQTMQERLDEKITAVSALPIPSASHRKPFYTYYTEPSIGHYRSTETSNEFSYQSTKFVMNLNVQAIMDSSTDIAQSIYAQQPIAKNTGSFQNMLDESVSYVCEIYQVDRYYAVFFTSSAVNLFGFTYAGDAAELAGKMYSIARSVIVRKDVVSQVYSHESAIDYEGEAINLYKDIAPEEGTLQELIDDKTRIDNKKDKSKTTDN
jgi:lipoprotein